MTQKPIRDKDDAAPVRTPEEEASPSPDAPRRRPMSFTEAKAKSHQRFARAYEELAK